MGASNTTLRFTKTSSSLILFFLLALLSHNSSIHGYSFNPPTSSFSPSFLQTPTKLHTTPPPQPSYTSAIFDKFTNRSPSSSTPPITTTNQPHSKNTQIPYDVFISKVTNLSGQTLSFTPPTSPPLQQPSSYRQRGPQLRIEGYLSTSLITPLPLSTPIGLSSSPTFFTSLPSITIPKNGWLNLLPPTSATGTGMSETFVYNLNVSGKLTSSSSSFSSSSSHRHTLYCHTLNVGSTGEIGKGLMIKCKALRVEEGGIVCGARTKTKTQTSVSNEEQEQEQEQEINRDTGEIHRKGGGGWEGVGIISEFDEDELKRLYEVDSADDDDDIFSDDDISRVKDELISNNANANNSNDSDSDSDSGNSLFALANNRSKKSKASIEEMARSLVQSLLERASEKRTAATTTKTIPSQYDSFGQPLFSSSSPSSSPSSSQPDLTTIKQFKIEDEEAEVARTFKNNRNEMKKDRDLMISTLLANGKEEREIKDRDRDRGSDGERSFDESANDTANDNDNANLDPVERRHGVIRQRIMNSPAYEQQPREERKQQQQQQIVGEVQNYIGDANEYNWREAAEITRKILAGK